LKTVVILLVVLNLLAAFFLLPADTGITGLNSSEVMPASGLALLSEVEVELKAPAVEKVEVITVVESTLIVEEIVSNDAVAAQETLNSSETVPALAVVTLRNPMPFRKENPVFTCGAIDGVNSIDAANELKKELANLNMKDFVISTSNQTKNKYWVYLGPYDSKLEATEANSNLRTKSRSGYVFTNDEVKNSISFGVFSSIENARRLQTELNGFGYRPKIWNQVLPLYILEGAVPVDSKSVSIFAISKGYVLSNCD
jgi:hypothetical protein